MGTLDRYQKSGGFNQLLQLIETCGPQKQEKFLSMVREENKYWAEAIEEKMINMDKILTWPDEIIAEIWGNLQELTIAVAFHGIKENDRPRLMRTFDFSKKRKIEDLFEINKPTPGDISTAFIKIFTEVRKLMTEGVLRPDRLDPKYFVEDGIEEKLKHKVQDETASNFLNQDEKLHLVKTDSKVPTKSPQNSAHTSSADVNISPHDIEEIKNLRRKMIQLTEEIVHLKQENHNLKIKMDQIKKLAA